MCRGGDGSHGGGPVGDQRERAHLQDRADHEGAGHHHEGTQGRKGGHSEPPYTHAILVFLSRPVQHTKEDDGSQVLGDQRGPGGAGDPPPQAEGEVDVSHQVEDSRHGKDFERRGGVLLSEAGSLQHAHDHDGGGCQCTDPQVFHGRFHVFVSCAHEHEDFFPVDLQGRAACDAGRHGEDEGVGEHPFGDAFSPPFLFLVVSCSRDGVVGHDVGHGDAEEGEDLEDEGEHGGVGSQGCEMEGGDLSHARGVHHAHEGIGDDGTDGGHGQSQHVLQRAFGVFSLHHAFVHGCNGFGLPCFFVSLVVPFGFVPFLLLLLPPFSFPCVSGPFRDGAAPHAHEASMHAPFLVRFRSHPSLFPWRSCTCSSGSLADPQDTPRPRSNRQNNTLAPHSLSSPVAPPSPGLLQLPLPLQFQGPGGPWVPIGGVRSNHGSGSLSKGEGEGDPIQDRTQPQGKKGGCVCGKTSAHVDRMGRKREHTPAHTHTRREEWITPSLRMQERESWKG
eukprot:scaffold492_cov341-Pavlova_lutheri.AAC.20